MTKTKYSSNETRGDIHFTPITDTTRRFVLPLFGVLNVKQCIGLLPRHILSGIGRGTTPPKRVFVVNGDGNCYFRSISLILIRDENYHEIIREHICNFISAYYTDLAPFCEYETGG